MSKSGPGSPSSGSTDGDKYVWVGDRVQLDCEVCDDKFLVKPYRKDDARFCSQNCKAEWQSGAMSGSSNHQYNGGKVTLECEWCGGGFDVTPALKNERRFCSETCYGEFASEHYIGENAPNWQGGDVEMICGQCGDTFTTKKSLADRRRFCGYNCLGEWFAENRVGEDNPLWQGGPEYYGPNWDAQRRKAWRRDQYRCQDCGVTPVETGKAPCAHHITPIKAFKREYDAPEWWERGNRLDNLICFCVSCHQKWEGIPLKPDLS